MIDPVRDECSSVTITVGFAKFEVCCGAFSDSSVEVAGASSSVSPEAGSDCYFKLYKSQIPIIEKAIEIAALMLGNDRSRGYCLEMIFADFLAGANLDNGDPETLLFSMTRFFRSLPAA